jgi:hypothetical protein
MLLASVAAVAMPIGQSTQPDPNHTWWLNPCAEPDVAALPYCDETLDSWQRALDLSARLSITDYLHYWNSTQRGPVAYAGVRIPPVGFVEGIHGAVTGGVLPPSTTTTNFPIGVGMGSSFDRDLVREIGHPQYRECLLPALCRVVLPATGSVVVSRARSSLRGLLVDRGAWLGASGQVRGSAPSLGPSQPQAPDGESGTVTVTAAVPGSESDALGPTHLARDLSASC